MPILTGTEDCREYKNIKTVKTQQNYTLQRITVITERKKVESCKKLFAIESPTASKKPYRYFALCSDPNSFPFRCQNIFWRTSKSWDLNFTIPWNTNIFSKIFGEFVASGIQSVSLCQYSTLEENWMPPQFIQKILRIFWLHAAILEFALSFMAALLPSEFR